MEGLEVVVLLGVAVLAGAVLALRWRIAPPLLLLVFGLVLGFVPHIREIELPPETVLLLFLPVMLFWEAMTTSLRATRRNLRGIVLMSTVLVVVTAFAVAGVAHLLGLPWDAALILGAALAPPDATAVAALGRMLPHRNFMVLKAESLTNDGTALVVYAIAVGLAVGGTYTPLTITGLVVLSYVGGIAAGVAIAAVAYLVMRRLNDPLHTNIALLITPFAAFLVAELIGASGVLAVVVAGLLLAYLSAGISTAASRRQTESTWPLGSYLLNGSLFVLIGIQVQSVAREIDPGAFGALAVIIVAVWVTLLIVRFVFQTVSVMIIRALDRRPSQRERRMTYRARVVSSVAGFRGAVSLAIALSVPTALTNGDPFPAREDIVFVTAGVIVLTLIAQGPLLPVVVRWARLPEDTAEEELRAAEQTLDAAAHAVLNDLKDTGDASPDLLDRLAHELHVASQRSQTLPLADGSEDSDARSEWNESVRVRLAIITGKRNALGRLRREGTIDDTTARRLQTRLDFEEQRLTGSDTFD